MTMESIYCFLLGLVVVPFGCFITGSDGLKDVSLLCPRFVRLGEDVTLLCKYDIENDGLYAVKWYRGAEEFYRYVPKEVPPQQVFTERRISVDVPFSNDTFVSLKNVQLENSGKYKCSVCVEQTFQTLSDIKELTIVAIGYERPKLFVEQSAYHPGDTGKANCSVSKSSHTVNLTWYIDDLEVSPSVVRTVTWEDHEDPKLMTTTSIFVFDVPHNYNLSSMRLSCKGQVFDIYSEFSTITIQTTPRRYSLSNQDTLLRSSATIRNITERFPCSIFISTLLFLLVWFTTIPNTICL